MDRGRRRHGRHHRRWWLAATAGASLAVLAACGGGHQADEKVGPRWHPDGPPDTTPIRVVDAPSARLQLRGMAAGRQPGIPWVGGGTLRNGRGHVPIPEPHGERAYAVAPYGRGAVQEGWVWTLTWSDAGGRIVHTDRRAESLGWSGTYDQAAWWDGATHEAVLADSASGRELQRYPAPVAFHHPRVVGWLGPGDVLLGSGRPSDRPNLWRPMTGTLIRTDGRPGAVSDVDRLVVENVPLNARSDYDCLTLASVDRPQVVLWHRCLFRSGKRYGAGQVSFSPDGRLLLVDGVSITHGDRPFVAVLDARTGDPRAWFDQGRYSSDRVGVQFEAWPMAFEDDTHVLFVVSDRTDRAEHGRRQAIVRCNVTTVTCELATTPMPWSPDGSRGYFLAASR